MAHLQQDLGWCSDCRRRVLVWRGGAPRLPRPLGRAGAILRLLANLRPEPWRCDRCGGTRVTRNATTSSDAREYDTSDY
jgi:hypothetical protein